MQPIKIDKNQLNRATYTPPLSGQQPPEPPRARLPRGPLILFAILVVIGLIEMALIAWHNPSSQKTNQSGNSSQNSSSDSSSTPPAFDKQRFSTDEASSIWAVVNKGRILPSNYTPSGLIAPNVPLRTYPSDPEMHVRGDTAKAMEKMFSAALAKGIELRLASGYRSYSEQITIYNNEVKSYGQVAADRESARPGHSEHQTGLAADIEPSNRVCEVDQCFDSTPEGKWLAANAYKYGFIIRYPAGKENLTGYKYEPWHVRYVGVDLAAQIYNTGKTLEQFFGLPAYTTYPTNSYQLR